MLVSIVGYISQAIVVVDIFVFARSESINCQPGRNGDLENKNPRKGRGGIDIAIGYVEQEARDI
jgi:hypothetical protein